MEERAENFVIDLDKPKEEVIEGIVDLLSQTDKKLEKEGEVALSFLVKKKGEKPKSFVYNLNKDEKLNAEKQYVFPKVVEEVLIREFNPKIANNKKLLEHVMEELKKDPYWSNRIVKLIKTLKLKEEEEEE